MVFLHSNAYVVNYVNFQVLNKPCILKISLSWSWYKIIFTGHWIHSASFIIFISMTMREVSL